MNLNNLSSVFLDYADKHVELTHCLYWGEEDDEGSHQWLSLYAEWEIDSSSENERSTSEEDT